MLSQNVTKAGSKKDVDVYCRLIEMLAIVSPVSIIPETCWLYVANLLADCLTGWLVVGRSVGRPAGRSGGSSVDELFD